MYPETGNGGYTSVHSDVYLSYDTEANLFLPGTRVVLTDVATQCLTDFRLDFERTWWDTVYPPGGGANRSQLTAPGLDGGGFKC